MNSTIGLTIFWMISVLGLGAVSAIGTYFGLRLYADDEEKRKSATK